MTVYKSANSSFFTSWCEGGPPGATYAANKSGWFDMEKFNSWFREVFLPYIRKFPREDVKVLIGDNLAAHLSPVVTELCQQNNIRFGAFHMTYLPYSTVPVFSPVWYSTRTFLIELSH
jgi:hypothetical protein